MKYALLFSHIIGVLLLQDVTVEADSNTSPRQEKYLPDYRRYHNLSRIYSEIADIVDRFPSYFQLDNFYTSREGYSQLLLRVSNFSDSRDPSDTSHPQWTSPKVKILLSYGEHAREFFPIETLFYLLRNLTQGLSAPRDSPEEVFSRRIFSKIDLFIVAMLNPDGRKYIEKTHNYCWRGTGTGVDLNRNFDWNFGGVGSSGERGAEENRGTHPFSEPECAVLVDLTRKYKFDTFVSFHSGIREIYLPFADSESKQQKRKPSNWRHMLELAKRMAQVIDPPFVYGQAFHVIRYPADGTIFDYMAGIRKIPFSYAVELWGEGDIPGVQCFDLFNPPSEELEYHLKMLHPLYEKLFLYLIEWKQKQLNSIFSIEADSPPLALCFVMLGLVVLLTAVSACHHRLPEWCRVFPRRRVISLKSLSSTLHMS